MKNFYQKMLPKYFKYNGQTKGITLFEILLAIAVVGILAVTVLPGFSKIKKIQILKSTTEEVVSVVEKARSQTLASLNSTNYGVHFDTNNVIIFTGDSFSEGAGDNQIINLIAPATISDIDLENSGVDVYFSRLSGIPNTTGTITLGVPGATSKIITISPMGSVSTN